MITRNMGDIEQVLKLAENIPDTPINVLRTRLCNDLKQRLIVSKEEDGVVKGYAYATIEYFDGEAVVFIQSTYVTPGHDIGGEFMEEMLKWARETNCKWIYMLTKRKEEPITRKYGFESVGTIMKKEV